MLFTRCFTIGLVAVGSAHASVIPSTETSIVERNAEGADLDQTQKAIDDALAKVGIDAAEAETLNNALNVAIGVVDDKNDPSRKALDKSLATILSKSQVAKVDCALDIIVGKVSDIFLRDVEAENADASTAHAKSAAAADGNALKARATDKKGGDGTLGVHQDLKECDFMNVAKHLRRSQSDQVLVRIISKLWLRHNKACVDLLSHSIKAFTAHSDKKPPSEQETIRVAVPPETGKSPMGKREESSAPEPKLNLTNYATEIQGPKFTCEKSLPGKPLDEIFGTVKASAEMRAQLEHCVWPAQVKPTKPRDPATCTCDKDIGDLLYHKYLAFQNSSYPVPAYFEDFRAWDCVHPCVDRYLPMAPQLVLDDTPDKDAVIRPTPSPKKKGRLPPTSSSHPTESKKLKARDLELEDFSLLHKLDEFEDLDNHPSPIDATPSSNSKRSRAEIEPAKEHVTRDVDLKYLNPFYTLKKAKEAKEREKLDKEPRVPLTNLTSEAPEPKLTYREWWDKTQKDGDKCVCQMDKDSSKAKYWDYFWPTRCHKFCKESVRSFLEKEKEAIRPAAQKQD